MIIHTSATKTSQRISFISYLIHPLSKFYLAHFVRQVVFAMKANTLRHICIEILCTMHTAGRQHLIDVLFCMREIFIIRHHPFVHSLHNSAYFSAERRPSSSDLSLSSTLIIQLPKAS